MKKLLNFILILITPTLLFAQPDLLKNLSGKWTGSLSIQNSKLRIVFNFQQENGIITATLDSPDQGAKGIPVKEVVVRNDSVIVDVASIMGQYKAVFTSDTSLHGVWYQGGMSLPLDIYAGEKDITKPMVEIRNPLYDSREVKIINEKANVTLAGTITIPKNIQNCPAVVLVSGSGAQNRDEELLGQKPFYRIADYLSSHGIAVLRYDDRGVAQSTGNFMTATSFDFATDADAAFNFLKKEPGLNPKKIGIAGHSEGGMIAPIFASQNKDVSFLILLAGTGISGKDIILTQTHALLTAQGLKQDTISQIVDLYNEILTEVIAQPNDSLAMLHIKEAILKRNFPEEARNIFMKGTPAFLNPWYKTFITIDPAKYLSQVQCRVLALNGSKDLQVLPKENLAAIEKALKQGKNNKFETNELLGYNHLFQQSEKGLISEYSNLDKPSMDDKVLQIMTEWILK